MAQALQDVVANYLQPKVISAEVNVDEIDFFTIILIELIMNKF